jgi:formate hydrogenlyase transcriptional activator
LLIWTFVEEFSKAMGKTVETIAKSSLQALHQYQWPGNVRELRNVIERAMILTSGTTLKIDLPGVIAAPVTRRVWSPWPKPNANTSSGFCNSLEGASGARGGAADILGLKPTTLESRMARLGLRRR